MHNVLIVDDHPFFLHGFSQYVESSGNFAITTALSWMKPSKRSTKCSPISLC